MILLNPLRPYLRSFLNEPLNSVGRLQRLYKLIIACFSTALVCSGLSANQCRQIIKGG